MSNFPKIIPAFTAHISITPGNTVGKTLTGQTLNNVFIIGGQGSLRSEPGYDIQFDSVWAGGSDYIHVDADGKHARLDADAIAKDEKSGEMIRFKYSGIVDLQGENGDVLAGKKDASTTEFGGLFMHVKFETGGEKLRALQERVFVASGRFVLESGKPATVEYKVGQVAL